MKKIISYILLFSLLGHNAAWAVELRRKGETHTFKTDMHCFTDQEAKQMLQDLQDAKANKIKIKLLETLVEQLEQNVTLLKQSLVAQESASQEYKASIQVFKESAQEYKNATAVYKDIVIVQAEALKVQMQQANSVRRTRRWERNLSFVLGFLAPVAGAWSVGRVHGIFK